MSTADLIAELRSKTGVNPWSYDHDDLVTRAADALEDAVAATSKDSQRVVSTVAELDALPAGSIVRAEYDGCVTAERAHGLWYVTTWGDDNGLTSQLLHDWVEAAAFTVLWVGGTE